MTLRLEIVAAPRGQAVVETYIGMQRTGMSPPMDLYDARLRGEASGVEVVDHTRRVSEGRP